MKKITFTLSLLFCGFMAIAQSGLENIIVEKYYVSNAEDSIGSADEAAGILPIGSVTYRIYADMLPGYKFQALYGTSTAEGDTLHELRIATTTSFFNNEDRGNTTPNGITVVNTSKNSVMIDTWLSVGAAAQGKVGVLKTDDTDGTIGNSASPAILQNNDTAAGIPINATGGTHVPEDGMVNGSPTAVTFVGNMADGVTSLSDGADNIFGAVSGAGSLFSTIDGSIAALTGSTGADSTTNMVLLGQFTTNGIFSFKLNIQIGTPDGDVEKYVAQDPLDSTETMLVSLSYTSPAPIVDTTHEDTSHVGIINHVVANALVSIYPNPAKDIVTINIANANSSTNMYSIYDAKGILVSQKRLSAISDKYTERVDVSSYPQGLYFIVLSLDGSITSKKIIKN